MGNLRLAVAAASDPGLKRPHNEDAHAMWDSGEPAERGRRGVLLVVSDGMGGSQAGEVASRITVDTVVRAYSTAPGGEPREELRAAIEQANRVVRDLGQSSPDLTGMGATCTAVVVRERDAWLGHVGDSRAYLVRNGRIQQLTQDHSLVAQLVQRHQLTPEEARVDPRRNVVTRSVGIADSVEVDAQKLDIELQAGDTLVLCSDGLHGQVSAEELAQAASGDPERAARELVALANQRGGPDNITVVLARIEKAPRDADAPGPGGESGAGIAHGPAMHRESHGAAPSRGMARTRAAASHSRARSALLLALALLALAAALAAGIWAVRRLGSESQRLGAAVLRLEAESPGDTT
jgi:PPM family protein phosphatase